MLKTDTADLEGFVPFSEEELSSLEFARRSLHFCQIVDDLTERLVSDGLVSTERMKKTPQRTGYTSYISVEGRGFAISFDVDAWLWWQDSPIWFASQSSQKIGFETALRHVAAQIQLPVYRDDQTYVPIRLLPGVEYERVIEDCYRQVKRIIEKVLPHLPGEQGT